jgi:hypothetical protein
MVPSYFSCLFVVYSGDFYLYANASGETPTLFNLDNHCHHDACLLCWFRNKVYYDKYLTRFARYTVGECIVVHKHLFYCTSSFYVEDKKEIAVQGFGDLGPDGTTFLITAACGIYKGEEGTLTATPDETKSKYFKYSFKFYDSAAKY